MDSRFSPRIDVLILASLRTEAQVVHKKSINPPPCNVAEPLQCPFHSFTVHERRISRQAAINLRLGRVMQHVKLRRCHQRLGS